VTGGPSSNPTSPQPQQQQAPPAWYGSPTYNLIQNAGTAPRQNEPRWNQEETAAGPGIRNLVHHEHGKKNSGVLDYAVPLPNLDHLSVTNQVGPRAFRDLKKNFFNRKIKLFVKLGELKKE
jgi:hypothetical protein